MMMGSAVIANVMGPDEDMLKPLGEPELLLVCDKCAMSTTVAELWEKTAKPAAEEYKL